MKQEKCVRRQKITECSVARTVRSIVRTVRSIERTERNLGSCYCVLEEADDKATEAGRVGLTIKLWAIRHPCKERLEY